MSSFQPIANVDTAGLAALADAIVDRLGPPGARARRLPADLEARRTELLSKYLAVRPVEPLPLLHVVGDSHSVFFGGVERILFHKGRRVWTGFFRARYVSAFTELLPVFRVFHVGPATAWQAYEAGSSTRCREKIHKLLRCGDLPPASRVLLVFGEIDCRCHIPKAVLAGNSVEKAVAATVDRFMRLPVHLKQRGLTPSVWLPSLQANMSENAQPLENQPLPVIGPQALRNEIAAAYCARLQAACASEGIATAGLARPAAAAELADCFLDNNHLSQRMMPTALAALVQAGILPLATAPALRPS